MSFGTVYHFDRIKLFGFLEAENGQDYFFHASKINLPGPWAARKVRPGDRVTFEVGTNRDKGNAVAVNVTPLASTPGGDGDEQQ